MSIPERLHPLQSWLQDLGEYFRQNYRSLRRRQNGYDKEDDWQVRNKAAERLLCYVTQHVNADDAIDEAQSDRANGRSTHLSRAFDVLPILRPGKMTYESVLRIANTDICLLFSRKRVVALQGEREVIIRKGVDDRSMLGIIKERRPFLRILLRRRQRIYVVAPIDHKVDLLETGHPAYVFTAILNSVGMLLYVEA